MSQPQFAPGFRFSALDVAILLVGGAAAVTVASTDRWTGLAIAFVVGHFFLFCNVLRMSRAPELVWAAVFTCLAVAATVSGAIAWPTVFASSTALTLVLATIEVRRPSYHGVGWEHLNPRLPEWWNQRVATRTPR